MLFECPVFMSIEELAAIFGLNQFITRFVDGFRWIYVLFKSVLMHSVFLEAVAMAKFKPIPLEFPEKIGFP